MSFDPEITTGDWELSKMGICNIQSGRINVASTAGRIDTHNQEEVDKECKENAKAIAAVPDLLEVYKAFCIFDDNDDFNKSKDKYTAIKEARKKLEERHGG